MNMKKATFGAGCFWGVESAFQQTPGIIDTKVGYMGGHLKDPTYEQVCTNSTGHAEVVHLHFDTNQITYEELLEIFWKIHDPTQKNRQGPDIGSQYRSVIFYHDTYQQQKALKSKEKLQKSGKFSNDIATEIMPATTFYPAEDYHQKYHQKHGLTRCPI